MPVRQYRRNIKSKYYERLISESVANLYPQKLIMYPVCFREILCLVANLKCMLICAAKYGFVLVPFSRKTVFHTLILARVAMYVIYETEIAIVIKSTVCCFYYFVANLYHNAVLSSVILT